VGVGVLLLLSVGLVVVDEKKTGGLFVYESCEYY
jgi:hypothetical protein